jgi:D-sedoheptulose 7-phosphate isomerase
MHIIDHIIFENLSESQRTLSKVLQSESILDEIKNAAQSMADCLLAGNKIISCGNGGSMSDAMHFAEELTGRFRSNRSSLAAVAISDPAFITCAANDYGFENVFSRFIEGVGRKGDCLLAISTSGNSQNVINAAHTAAELDMKVIGLTGKGGGKLASFCDVNIIAPDSEWADRAQEIHIKVIHCFIHCIEHILNDKIK